MVTLADWPRDAGRFDEAMELLRDAATRMSASHPGNPMIARMQDLVRALEAGG